MLHNVSLNASMRANLLSLQQTSKLQDITSNRLSTGLKVNSAIDNPSAYYTAQSLSDRASDLNALLDAMSQGIQTLKAVAETIDAASGFLQQAKAVASQALETAQPIIASVATEDELLAAVNSGKKGLIVVNGEINITNHSLQLSAGQSLVGSRYIGIDKNSKLNFNFDTAENAINLKNNSIISDLEINYTAQAPGGKIISLDGGSATIRNITASLDTSDTIAGSDVGMFGAINGADLRLEGFFNTKAEGYNHRMLIASGNSAVTIAGNTVINHTGQGTIIRGIEFYDQSTLNIESGCHINFDLNGTGTSSYLGIYMNNAIADITDSQITMRLNGNKGEALAAGRGVGARINIRGNTRLNIETDGENCYGLDTWNSGQINIYDQADINIKNKGGSSYGLAVYLSSSDGKEFPASINIFSPDVKMNIVSDIMLMFRENPQAENSVFIASGSLISWKTPDGTTQGVWQSEQNNKLTASGSQDIKGFDGLDGFSNTGGQASDIEDLPADLTTKTETGQTAATAEGERYQELIRQYDALIRDGSYKGVNLLRGDSLKVSFNEDSSSSVNIPGVDASSQALGISMSGLTNSDEIEKIIVELENAVSRLRSFASLFGNYNNILSTRQNFTEAMINVLEEGADKLTLADMNQESANMLALQTRQMLAVNSLSLASQANQSVLKLF